MRIYGWKGRWVAVSRNLDRLELYQPHVVRFTRGRKGVIGRTPFEALYRAQRYERELFA